MITVQPQDVPIFNEYVGATFAEQEVAVNARVNGYIQQRHYNTGDVVNQNQLLYTIDPRTYQAEVDRAKAERSRAEAQLRFAREGVDVIRAESEVAQSEATLLKADQDVARVRPLVKENALPEQDLDTAIANQRVADATTKARRATLVQQRLSQKTQIEQGEAALAAVNAALVTAELNLSFCFVRAPVSGRIGETRVQVGGLAQANSPEPLTVISPLDPMYVQFKVGERDYLEYQKKQIAGKGGAVAPLQLVLADGSTYNQAGTYRYADRAVDVQTGTLKLIGTFPNPNRLLLPGQFSRIRLRTSDKPGVYLVPQRAIIEMQGLRMLLVVDSANKVTQRTVTATDRKGNLWVIEKGLNPGDRVIVDGLQKAAPGSTVNPQTTAAPAL